jgi:two-component system sensor histidine kinase NreB
VHIARERDRLRLTIADDGQGFDTGVPGTRGAHVGLGLLGIRERLGPLGGTLEIRSAPGVGTELHIDLPAKGPLHAARPAG